MLKSCGYLNLIWAISLCVSIWSYQKLAVAAVAGVAGVAASAAVAGEANSILQIDTPHKRNLRVKIVCKIDPSSL